MGNLFAITTPAEDIKADAGGKASAVFTVTNTSNKPVRGIAKSKALGNTQQDWLDIQGELERDFAANGTQQFTVNFSKPAAPAAATASAAAEKFPFRLDIASALNPDEQFTEGPTVNVEVKSAAAPPAAKKPFPLWLILVIAGGGLLVIALILFLVFQKGCNAGDSKPAAKIEGNWRPDNADPNFTFIASMEIKQNGKEVEVRITCRQFQCQDWGVGKGQVSGDTATVEWKNEVVTGKTTIELLEPDRLMVEGSFEPKSGMLHPTVKASFARLKIIL